MSTTTCLLDALAAPDPVIMDGAMGTELARTGPRIGSGNWAASTLGAADQVSALHRRYVAAGARLHIANTFAAGRHVLTAAGLEDDFVRVNQSAVQLCRRAVAEAALGPHWIAGSISTYVIGSDRSGLPALPVLKRNVEEQARILAGEGCDMIVLEMLFDIDTSLVMMDAAAATGLPVSVGLTCTFDTSDEPCLRGTFSIGQNQPMRLSDALPQLVKAMLPDDRWLMTIMHSDLDVSSAALAAVEKHWTGMTGCYPNSGRMRDKTQWNHDGICTPAEFTGFADAWQKAGVNMIGGCCGIGPAHIAAFAASRSGQNQKL